jgi:spore coat protein X
MKESVWAESSSSSSSCGHKKWTALDPQSAHPMDMGDVNQELQGKIETIQQSFEQIVVKDSADVEISTTDNKAAVNVQVAIQAAIALVISISIADGDRAQRITQELLGNIKNAQVNRQQTIVENSRGVRITTTDNDLVVNVQVLLQVLVALLVRISVL